MRLDGGFAFASTNQIIRSVRHSSWLELDMAKVSWPSPSPQVSLSVIPNPNRNPMPCRPQSQPSVMTGDVGVLVAVIVQCMKSSALASDLNSLMDQLAHVPVITHNTFPRRPDPIHPSIHPCTYTHLDPHPYRPVIRPSIRPCPSGPRPPPFDVWRESTFDGRSVRTGIEPCSNSLAALACLFQCWPICKLNDCRWLLFSVPWYRVGNDFFIFRYPMAPDLLAINKIEVS